MKVDKIANQRLRVQKIFAVDLIFEWEKWCNYLTGGKARQNSSDNDDGSSRNQDADESSKYDGGSMARAESLDDDRVEAWQTDLDDLDGRCMIEDKRFVNLGVKSESSDTE